MDLDFLNVSFKRIMQKRRELLESPNYKECFTCKDIKHIDDFGINPSKYQRPAQKGRNINCNQCVKKRQI